MIRRQVVLGCCAAVLLPSAAAAQARPIVVASKPFAESYVLAEVFAQLLEARGHVVDRRLGLGTTDVALQALARNEIDVYPEYTGTGLAAVLAESSSGGSAAVFRRVSDAFLARWGARWLPPLGFANNYAVAMRRGAADSLGVRTLSGLARIAPRLSAGFSPDFAGRADGLLGLTEAYDGMEFRDVRNLLQAVKYQALAEGEVDVIDAYSTDGAVARYDLAVMTDDQGFFPPYDAAPLASRRFYEERPEATLLLSRLAGRIDEAVMRRANERVELAGATPAQAARELLVEIGLGATGGADSAPDGDLAGNAGPDAAPDGDGAGNADPAARTAPTPRPPARRPPAAPAPWARCPPTCGAIGRSWGDRRLATCSWSSSPWERQRWSHFPPAWRWSAGVPSPKARFEPPASFRRSRESRCSPS